jgi:Fe-S cluster assembly protein SufD
METLTKQSVSDKLIELVEKNSSTLKSDLYSDFRKEGLAALKSIGLPGRKHEEYKYANPEKLFRSELRILNSIDNYNLDSVLKNYKSVFPSAEFIVLNNGFLDKSRSTKQVEDLNNTEALKLLGKMALVNQDVFVALNSSLFTDIAFIKANKNQALTKPFVIVNVISEESLLVNPRILIHAEQGSFLNVIELTVNLNKSATSVCNILTEVKVETNARVNYYKLQHAGVNDQTVSTLQVSQDNDSYFDTNNVTLSGSWIRNNLNIVLNGTNCETHLNGLFITNHQLLVDNHTLVDHQMPHCNSNQLYKGILRDKSTGVFNGKIYVRRDAQKTNAYQSSKNMLLSDDATINTKPQLEIYADDVRCSHGSSTGKIDTNALFYLKTRGIGEENAKQLLMFAFANDVVNTIRIEEYRAYVEQLLEEVL